MSGAKKKDYLRTNSICPSVEAELREAVINNDIEMIVKRLQGKPDLISHIYDFPDCKSILSIACLENGTNAETVKTLIEYGADLNSADENSMKPIHLAAQNTNSQVLAVIVQKLKPGAINDLAENDNALHVLIKYGERDDESFKCAKILLEAGIDVNQTDEKGRTVILEAARKGYQDIVQAILEYSIAHVDLDSHKWHGKTARTLIEEKNLYVGRLPEINRINNNDPLQLMLNLIKQSNEAEFVRYLPKYQHLIDINDGEMLWRSCERGLGQIVSCLINHGANINLAPKLNKKPIELAAECGYHEIVAIMVEHPNIQVTPKVLCPLLKCLHFEKNGNIDFEKCYNILLDKLRTSDGVDWNEEDENTNTPLHYAIRYAGSDHVNELLELGASLASRNSFQTMPVEDIEPAFLEKHLNDCIKFDIKSKNFDKTDFEITFNYRTLVPPIKTITRTPSNKWDIENTPIAGHFDDVYVEETDVITYISETAEFRDLLKHPVIVSFLFMKWYRIQRLFYYNLLFYILFVLSLIVYIFSYYCNFNEKSFEVLTIGNCSWLLLWSTSLLLIIRELFQIIVTAKTYFTNFENYIELILITITALILLITSPTEDIRKQLASIAILLAAFELVLMLGQHPKLSTNVVMLRTVSKNFFKLLSWYSLLIVAFALCFYILFSKPLQIDKAQNATSTEEDSPFMGPGISIFKTIVMLTGEFDASSIDFHTYPLVSKFVFSLFVFMITIILLNLLNGLAVSDTQLIKNEAELISLIERAKHVRYVERIILGNLIPNNLINWFKIYCCCLPTSNLFFGLPKSLAKRVSIFPQLGKYKLTVLPNNCGQIIDDLDHHHCYRNHLYLDKQTVRRTKSIIRDKREYFKMTNELNEFDLKQRIALIEAGQNHIRTQLTSIMDIIMNKDHLPPI